MKKTILLTLILFAFVVQPAFAYIDPGSGSAFMSVIIGFFVAIGVLIKTFWYKIKSFFGLSKNSKPKAESSNDSTDRN
jgi:O-antigen/teichoic acid export membrane protein